MYKSTKEMIAIQLNSILFPNHITFDNEYMKCAHKTQKIETAIKKMDIYDTKLAQ